MTMQEFYDTYNLNKYNFAEMAGVGTRSLIKFAEGKPLRNSTRERIKRAIRIVKDRDLKRPEYDYGKAFTGGFWYRNDFNRRVHEYEDDFKKLLNREDS